MRQGGAELAIVYAGDPEGLLEAARLNSYSFYLSKLGDRHPEALAIGEQAVDRFERALGPMHPRLATALNGLGLKYENLYDDLTALAKYKRALAIFEATLGPDHARVASTLGNIANIHGYLGDSAAAREPGERALAIRERTLDPHHQVLAVALANIIEIRFFDGDTDGALAAGDRALAIIRETDLNEPGTPLNLALVHLHLKDPERARPFAQSVADAATERGDRHGVLLPAALYLLGEVELATGKPAKARELGERALTLAEAKTPPSPFRLAEIHALLADVALTEGRPADARDHAERILAILADRPGIPRHVPRAHFALARALDALGTDPDRARAEAETARDGHRRLGPVHAPMGAEVEAWLAARAPSP